MNLTKQEKDLIILLQNHTVYKLHEFITSQIKTEEVPYTRQNTISTDQGDNYYYNKGDIVNCIEDTEWEEKIISFIRVCKLLESKSLITFISNSKSDREKNIKYMHKKRNSANPKLHEDFYSTSIDMVRKSIIVFPALKVFIESNFQTEEENALTEEKIARIYAQKLTKLIAVISLAATAIIGIVQIYISVCSEPNVHVQSINSDIIKSIVEKYKLNLSTESK
jgi:hypothetical protein